MPSPAELKAEILRLTREYSALMHTGQRPGDDPAHAPWAPGQTIPYAGRVFDTAEVEAAVGATLDFWLTLGPEGEAFEKELAALLGVKHSLLVNSGSSANLVAFAALTTHKLPPHKRILPGDEVITVAAGFPTTVAPIIQLGAVAVFIDNDPATGNVRPEQLEAAFVPGKTKAVMIAHALGNPFDLGAVLEFCRRHDLWLVEDNCDALGCTYSMPESRARALGITENSPGIPSDGVSITRYTGTWGDLSTQSFYPPHHLTMGEGGAVNIISRPPLKTYAESFRDWGRDCWCASGKDDTCGKRFGWQLGELPKGYDHKYIYSHLGFNLKPLDPQAAIGRQQLKKLPAFIEARKRNWEILRAGLADLEDVFEFTLPTHAKRWLPPSERGESENSEMLKRGNAEKAETEKAESENAEMLKRGNAESGSSDLSKFPNFSVSKFSSSSSSDLSDFPNFSVSKFSSSSAAASSFPACFEWDSSGCRTDASWFGFMLRVKPGAPFSHTDLARHLDERKIGNRMFFGGNLLRQPVFVQLRKDRPSAFRVVGEMRGADEIMHQALFLGTYPGLTPEMLAYEIQVIRDFVRSREKLPAG